VNTVQRAQQLLDANREALNEIEKKLKTTNLAEDDAAILESMLVDRRWPPNFMGLTGPAGHNPQPVYEKCNSCNHYRLK
jgi:hypothetical protein